MQVVRTTVPTHAESVWIVHHGKVVRRTDTITGEFAPPTSDAVLKFIEWDDINHHVSLHWMIQDKDEKPEEVFDSEQAARDHLRSRRNSSLG